MKIKIVKDHSAYAKGEADVTTERANYLIRVGVAEKITEPTKKKK